MKVREVGLVVSQFANRPFYRKLVMGTGKSVVEKRAKAYRVAGRSLFSIPRQTLNSKKRKS